MSTVTWYLPGSAPPATPSPIAPALGTNPVGHVELAISRLPEQFKKPLIIGLVAAFARPAVALEDALQQLLTERNVNTAIGAQLDVIGEIVGQPRNVLTGALTDDDYRRYIRARIAANSSTGILNHLIRVARLVLADDAYRIEMTNGHGTVVVRLYGVPTSDPLAAITLAFLQDAVAAGVRIVLESLVADETDTYTLDQMLTLFGPHSIGANALVTNEGGDWGYWPATGTIEIDGGVNLETRTYMVGGGGLLLLGTPLAKAHVANTEVRLVAAQQSGKGLGNSGDSGQPTLVAYGPTGTVGGHMADVRD